MNSQTLLESNDDFDRETFRQLDLTEGFLSKKSFTHCTFEHCQLFETQLSGCRFEHCEFIECDLSMAKVDGSIFLNVAFKKCKLMGVNWTVAKHLHVLKASFDECVLTYGSFFGMDLKDISFNACVAHEVNFGEADLSEVSFAKTDLKDSDFLSTNLTRADFRSAKNYAISPVDNIVKEAKFSFPEALSLLKGFDVEVDLGVFEPEE